jgi:D-sedoheptulose 7-phosphate isomerase
MLPLKNSRFIMDVLPDASGGTIKYFESYLSELKNLLDSIDRDTLKRIVDTIHGAWRQNKRLIIFGNGGSGSTSSHLVCDFQKNIYLDGLKPFEVLALTDSPALISAWGNDTNFENVFAGQLSTWVRPNDVVLAISGSGNSKNVLEAVKLANEAGAVTIGLCGYNGGQLAELVEIPLIAHRNNMQQVEDVHMIVGHMIFSALRDRITGYLRDENPAGWFKDI